MSFNFKQRLDQYLTTPPENSFTNFCELLYECYTDKQYNEMEEVHFIESRREEDWINKLLYKDYSPNKSVEILYRAFKLYKPYL